MKTLNECKEFFIDAFITMLDYDDESTHTAMRQLNDTLEWIYGDEYKNIKNTWAKEACDEYFGKI